MSNFTCSICNTLIGECRCDGRDNTLRSLAYLKGSRVAMKWCRLCDKHYARCRCSHPSFYIIMGGVEMSPVGIRDVLGKLVIPDLTGR